MRADRRSPGHMQEEDQLEAPRLRSFLSATRLIGLLVALLLTNFHNDAPNPPPLSHGLVTALVLVYHSLACWVTAKGGRGAMIGIILCDLGFGGAQAFSYGSPYLILGFMLPVLEVATFFGRMAGLSVLLLGGLFFGALLALPLLSMMKEAQNPQADVDAQVKAAQAVASLRLAGVQAVLSGLFLWVVLLVVSERQAVEVIELEAQQEKEMLYKKFQSKSQEFGKVIAEVGERETTVLSLEGQLASSNRERLDLEDRLLAAGDDVDNLKKLNQSLETSLRELEERCKNEVQRQKTGLERENFVLQKKYDKLGRFLAICKELNQSLGLNDTLLALTAQLQSVLPCQSCVIFLVDQVDGHKELFPEVAASPYTEAFRNRVFQFDQDAPGWCAANRRPLRIDEQKIQVGDRVIETLTPHEHSALVCPLATPQDVLGAIYLGRVEAHEFSPEEGEFLVRIADFASLCLANALEYQRRINRGLHDSLTKLYNGLYLEERMKEEVMRGRRYTYPVSLILVDIDAFGEAAEQMGPTLAEKVINEIADIIRQAVRETDVPARIDGDDFAILLVHTERDKARPICERIRAAVEARVFSAGQQKHKVTISVGLAGVPHDGTSVEVLKKRAEDGLSVARSKGGNTVSCWDG